MPADAGDLGLNVIPELKDFGKDLARKLKPAIDEADRKTRGLGSRLGSSIGGGLKKAAVVGGLALGVLGAGALAYGKTSMDAFTASNVVTKQTQAVLKSTGGAAGVSGKQIAGMADHLRNLSGMEDEAIQNGENLLLTFTNIRNEQGKGNDIFNQATVAMTDLSAALGQDTKSSAIQLGKALNDPVKGITALSRVGVSFTQEQKDQVKAMVDAGDTIGAQKLILRELTKEFAGSAKAMGKANPAAILKSQAGDVQETIGKAIRPIVTNLMSALAPLLQQLAPVVVGLIGALAPVFKSLLQAIVPIISALLTGFAPVLVGLVPIVQALAPIFLELGLALSQILIALAPLMPVFAQLLVALTPLLLLTVRLAVVLVKLLAPALAFLATILSVVIAAVSGFVENWRSSWNTVKGIALSVWNAIKGAILTPFNAMKSKLFAGLTLIASTWDAVWSGVSGFVAGIWNSIVGFVKSGINIVIDVMNGLIRAWNFVPFHADVALIPHLAAGTEDFAGGLALVGESGPELVDLPPHARVANAMETKAALRGGGTTNVFQQVMARPEEIVAALAFEELRRGIAS